jgi:catechol 2,3-dioxygenase-like lactoylglutathione lyase family enzyme
MKDLKFKYSLNIAINVRQSAKAIDFYQNTLGLGLVSLNPGKECGTEMSAGPLALWIDECSPTEEEHVGKVFFEFETNNLELARKTLIEKGVQIGRETQGSSFTGFMALDPYGMRFHVFAKS